LAGRIEGEDKCPTCVEEELLESLTEEPK